MMRKCESARAAGFRVAWFLIWTPGWVVAPFLCCTVLRRIGLRVTLGGQMVIQVRLEWVWRAGIKGICLMVGFKPGTRGSQEGSLTREGNKGVAGAVVCG